MKAITPELKNMITEFVVREIGSKGLHGVTYATLINRDGKSETEYLRVAELAVECGYTEGELFEAFEVDNGYIYNLDMQVMNQVLIEIAKNAVKVTGKHDDKVKTVYNMPVESVKKEEERLARLIEGEVKNGNNSAVIVLYSRNKGGTASFTADEGGSKKFIRVKAFMLRHKDLNEINTKYLSRKGIVITKIELHQIIPSQNGVIATVNFRASRGKI